MKIRLGAPQGTRSGAALVRPQTAVQDLCRGRIWVDASDFAVVRLEAEPTKNPSFWTKKADIVQVYTKVSDFWLPAYNHNITAIRLGGHADLIIEYKDYAIPDASKVGTLIDCSIDSAKRLLSGFCSVEILRGRTRKGRCPPQSVDICPFSYKSWTDSLG